MLKAKRTTPLERQNSSTFVKEKDVFCAPFTLKSAKIYRLNSLAYTPIYKENIDVDSLKDKQVNVSPFYQYSNIITASRNYEISIPLISDTQSSLRSSKIENLKESYEFLNSDEIVLYLLENLDVIYFLEEILINITKYFTFEEISLGLIHDTDISDSSILELRITTSDDVDSVLLSKEKFNEEFWFLSSFDLIKNLIIGFNFR